MPKNTVTAATVDKAIKDMKLKGFTPSWWQDHRQPCSTGSGVARAMKTLISVDKMKADGTLDADNLQPNFQAGATALLYQKLLEAMEKAKTNAKKPADAPTKKLCEAYIKRIKELKAACLSLEGGDEGKAKKALQQIAKCSTALEQISKAMTFLAAGGIDGSFERQKTFLQQIKNNPGGDLSATEKAVDKDMMQMVDTIKNSAAPIKKYLDALENVEVPKGNAQVINAYQKAKSHGDAAAKAVKSATARLPKLQEHYNTVQRALADRLGDVNKDYSDDLEPLTEMVELGQKKIDEIVALSNTYQGIKKELADTIKAGASVASVKKLNEILKTVAVEQPKIKKFNDNRNLLMVPINPGDVPPAAQPAAKKMIKKIKSWIKLAKQGGDGVKAGWDQAKIDADDAVARFQENLPEGADARDDGQKILAQIDAEKNKLLGVVRRVKAEEDKLRDLNTRSQGALKLPDANLKKQPLENMISETDDLNRTLQSLQKDVVAIKFQFDVGNLNDKDKMAGLKTASQIANTRKAQGEQIGKLMNAVSQIRSKIDAELGLLEGVG